MGRGLREGRASCPLGSEDRAGPHPPHASVYCRTRKGSLCAKPKDANQKTHSRRPAADARVYYRTRKGSLCAKSSMMQLLPSCYLTVAIVIRCHHANMLNHQLMHPHPHPTVPPPHGPARAHPHTHTHPLTHTQKGASAFRGPSDSRSPDTSPPLGWLKV